MALSPRSVSSRRWLMFRSFVPVLAVAALVVDPFALFAAESVSSDEEIRTKVERKLADKDLDEVQVQVKNRAVILHGTVPNAWVAKRAIDVARDVDEADAVVSDMVVVGSTTDDDTLAREVAERLGRYASYDVFDAAGVSVKDGVATLTGRVTSDYKRRDLEEAAARVPGVHSVVNRIQLLTPSPMDDALRIRVAEALYRDPVFTHYTAGGRPPIHVVVDHGHVRLVGTVSTELERRKAEAIVRSMPGAFTVTSELQVD